MIRCEPEFRRSKRKVHSAESERPTQLCHKFRRPTSGIESVSSMRWRFAILNVIFDGGDTLPLGQEDSLFGF